MTVRVLHVIRSDGFAGVEGHVARLAAAQTRQGLDVRVIGGDGGSMRRALGAGIDWRPAVTTWDALLAIDAWRDSTVIHAHMTAAELAAALAVRARPPLVVTRHFASPRGASVPGRLAAGPVRRRLAAQIAISRYVAERIDGPSTVVYPGVPTVPDVTGPRDRVVLVAQRLEREKRTEDAVDAFAASGLAAEGWRMEIAGDGSERDALKRQASALLPGGAVRFLGHRSDVADLMARAGILLAPCRVEGLGLTVLEAMATGLPVVATALGAHPETVGSITGARLFTDVPSAAALLRGLALDEAGRAEYGRRLRDRQREAFTLEAQAEATEAVYRRVL